MFKHLSCTLASLVAMSLMANPVYAQPANPFNQESSRIVLAHNDDKEKKEDERHERAEEREKRRHEKKEEKNKAKEERKHKKEKKSERETEKSEKSNASATQPPAETPHVSGNMAAPTGQANVSGAPSPGGAAHVSGK